MLDSSSSETARRAPALPTLLTIEDVARVLRHARPAVRSTPWPRAGNCRASHGSAAAS